MEEHMKKARDLLIGDRMRDPLGGDIRIIVKVETSGAGVTVRFEDGGRALFSGWVDVKIVADASGGMK